MVLILFTFIFLSWYLGYIVSLRIVPKFPKLFLWAGAFLVGSAIAVPIIYILSCAFVPTGQPLLWGTIATIALLCMVSIRYRRPITISFSFSDVSFLFFAFGFSYWLMFKTFHGNSSGLLFVGSNNIFDFGLSLGLIQSISQGVNIPFGSPFFAGFPMFYHFLFPFYCAVWQYFGVPIVWAVNGPSILSFATLLLVIYSLPELFGIKGKLVGWIGVLLTITHPTLTFWKYIIGKGISIETLKGLWQIPTYPFAGPFDGSTISIFMTLNNYINQRHLAFAVALGFVCYAVVWKIIAQTKRTSWHMPVIVGIAVAALFYWNVVLCGAIALAILLLFVVYKQIKAGIVFGCTIGVVVIFSLIPYVPTLIELFRFAQIITTSSPTVTQPTWLLWTYLWENLGILPFVATIGYVVLGKRRQPFLPMIVLSILLSLFAGYHNRGFDQKLLSFFIIPINILTAVGLVWIWNKKSLMVKVLSCVLFLVLTISGVVDLLVVKNEFAYPVISSENSSVISWIQTNTPKNAVFVSYSDMIDPVVLAGRKNYFGFFGNIGWTDRSQVVKAIFAGDITTAGKLGISHILMPKWNISDFPYVVDTMYFQKHRMVVYEDERFLIVEIR